MMFAIFVILMILMILVIVRMRVRGVVPLHMMFHVRFIVMVDDHRIHPHPPNRIHSDTEHHQHAQANRAGEPRKVRSLRVG